MTTEQQVAIEYLHKYLIEVSPPDFPEMTLEQKEDAWLRMPDGHRLLMADMILGFSKGHPALDEIIAQKKKNHSDMSFGMVVKGILSQYKL